MSVCTTENNGLAIDTDETILEFDRAKPYPMADMLNNITLQTLKLDLHFV